MTKSELKQQAIKDRREELLSIVIDEPLSIFEVKDRYSSSHTIETLRIDMKALEDEGKIIVTVREGSKNIKLFYAAKYLDNGARPMGKVYGMNNPELEEKYRQQAQQFRREKKSPKNCVSGSSLSDATW